jgi:DNA primase
MGRIPDDTIQAIRDRVDLVELVGRYVALRPAGRNHKGLCPFHDERTPSFNVNAERQIFHCFGCGTGGNAFTFLMRQENLTFPEAARELAREVGIEIRDDDPAAAGVSERLRAANEVAQAFYREELASARGAGAREYLVRRGVDAATTERFAIGFAPDRWDALVEWLRRAGVAAELAARAGLLAERARGGHYDRLRGRVTFPIRDARGRILGFGGRALATGQEPKYLNGPESPLYRKREALFGLPGALEPIRRAGRAVVVEGYFDVVALHRAGIGETLATCGTALTPEHARELRRRTAEVVLLFDGDEAGARAARGALEVLLPVGLRVRHAELPAGEDPDSLLAREGTEALRRTVDGAQPGLEVAIVRACARGLATPWQRADAVRDVAPLLALITDPVERGEFARMLALRAGVREEDVDAALAALRSGRTPEAPAEAPRRRGPEARWLRNLVAALLDQPQLAERVPLDELGQRFGREPALLLVDAMVRATLAGDPVEDGLEGEARRLYHELVAADDRPTYDEDAAIRAIDETITKLRTVNDRGERRQTTREFATGAQRDDEALIARKNEELRRRRELSRVPPGTIRH